MRRKHKANDIRRLNSHVSVQKKLLYWKTDIRKGKKIITKNEKKNLQAQIRNLETML